MNIGHEGRPLEAEKGRMEFQVEKGERSKMVRESQMDFSENTTE